MSGRELVVLGTASQAPTRTRSHVAGFLRFDGEGILFDPGEGAQRQLLLAGVSASSITRICLTHAHGDHCLGLPGVLGRLALDRVDHPVDLYYPAGAAAQVRALITAASGPRDLEVREHPVAGGEVVADTPVLRLETRWLDHRVETVGWRLVEADGRTMLPDRVAAAGVAGPDVGWLQRRGVLELDGRTVRLEDVSAPRRGQRVAWVMDTRVCRGADELADGADLLVCESTYLDAEVRLAGEYRHLTARQAGAIARRAGARRLVLTHFSSRYGDDPEPFLDQAGRDLDVVVARDLDVVPVPQRRG